MRSGGIKDQPALPRPAGAVSEAAEREERIGNTRKRYSRRAEKT